jgi:hypothetical protein
MAKCIEGCCEVLLLMGIRGKKYGTSHVHNRVIKARMGYSAGNRLPLGGFPFPSRYVHPRHYLSGELAENQLARKGPVEMSCR